MLVFFYVQSSMSQAPASFAANPIPEKQPCSFLKGFNSQTNKMHQQRSCSNAVSPFRPTVAKQMVQCQGNGCGFWQHSQCAGMPKALPATPAGTPPPRTDFFCEVCRSAMSNPFWEVLSTDMLPPVVPIKTTKTMLVSWGLCQDSRLSTQQ